MNAVLIDLKNNIIVRWLHLDLRVDYMKNLWVVYIKTSNLWNEHNFNFTASRNTRHESDVRRCF